MYRTTAQTHTKYCCNLPRINIRLSYSGDESCVVGGGRGSGSVCVLVYRCKVTRGCEVVLWADRGNGGGVSVRVALIVGTGSIEVWICSAGI